MKTRNIERIGILSWVSILLTLLLFSFGFAQREDKVTLTLTGEQDGESLYTVTTAGRDGQSTSATTLKQALFDLGRERLVTSYIIAELQLRQYEGEEERVLALQRDLVANGLKARELARTIDMIRRY